MGNKQRILHCPVRSVGTTLTELILLKGLGVHLRPFLPSVLRFSFRTLYNPTKDSQFPPGHNTVIRRRGEDGKETKLYFYTAKRTPIFQPIKIITARLNIVNCCTTYRMRNLKILAGT
jgi:hypothetical protein